MCILWKFTTCFMCFNVCNLIIQKTTKCYKNITNITFGLHFAENTIQTSKNMFK